VRLIDPGPRPEAETEVWKARHLIGKERQEDELEGEMDKVGMSSQIGGGSSSRTLASTSTVRTGLSVVQKGKRPATPDSIGNHDKKQRTLGEYDSGNSTADTSSSFKRNMNNNRPPSESVPRSPMSTPFGRASMGSMLSDTQASQQSTPRKTSKESRSLLIRDAAGSEYRFNVTATDTGQKVARGLARLGGFRMDRLGFYIENFGNWSMNKTVRDVELWELLGWNEDLQPDVTMTIDDVRVMISARTYSIDMNPFIFTFRQHC
jgi:hypothetical protein